MVAVTTLHDALLQSSREAFLKAAVGVIDAEVSEKRGATGLAVKAGYGAVNKINPELVSDALDVLLPGFVGRLEPHWSAFREAGTGTFGAYLAAREDLVAEELLDVTDARVAQTRQQAVKKVYETMRPSAKRHVAEALPRLGDVIEQHASR